jgi:hypothetical protein
VSTLITWVGVAVAGTPVVVDGPLDGAVAEVATRTGLLPESLSAVALDVVATHGIPDAAPCTGPPVSQAELSAQLRRATSAYNRGRLPEARAVAADLARSTPCLSELIDPNWAWSAGFFTGVVEWASGDREVALRSWVQARGVDPARPWDKNYSPRDATPTFAAALSGAPVPFHAVGGPFWVDGRPAAETIRPGLRVIQGGEPLQTWVVDVHLPLAAVHPAANPHALPLEALIPVLATRLGGSAVAYVVRGPEVTRVELPAGLLFPVLPPVPEPNRPWWRTALTITGGALLAGSLVEGAFAGVAARRSVVEGRLVADDPDALALHAAEWDDAWRRIYASAGIGAAGSALILVVRLPFGGSAPASNPQEGLVQHVDRSSLLGPVAEWRVGFPGADQQAATGDVDLGGGQR